MTKIGKKVVQDFFSAVSKVFDRVKTVALWSAKEKKINKKDHKGLRFRN
jgi:flagellar biosynthesis protein FlhB